ncbi:hypothetical protein MWN34_12065 [Ancylobacter sp. 6x-1]|uniref:Uncharacterized protein n=1 Tax=Ancylobacter crimeensis TaxID=2579147 RepID=A0ABT0DCF9_9HYPH|nr:hypothetical protein [Ancylobacter crimeensis]MCK0197648.1 hypothetical protein [Ancylobacter crimeensis]
MDEIVLTATEMENAAPLRKSNAAQDEMFCIQPHRDHWHVVHDGDRGSPYPTQRAAFDAAIAEMWAAVEAGHAATLRIAHVYLDDLPPGAARSRPQD